MPKHHARGRPEIPVPIIKPNAVVTLEIVAYIQIRETILIQISAQNGQTPIQWGLLQRTALLVSKTPVGPGSRREMTSTIIEIQHVGFTQFKNAAFRCNLQSLTILGQRSDLVAIPDHRVASRTHGVCPV